jgi:hypothetical protein
MKPLLTMTVIIELGGISHSDGRLVHREPAGKRRRCPAITSITKEQVGGYCFWTSPSFLMRDSKVVGLTPSSSAAAFVPRIRLLQRSSARKIYSRSAPRVCRNVRGSWSQLRLTELDVQRRTAASSCARLQDSKTAIESSAISSIALPFELLNSLTEVHDSREILHH